MAKSKGTKIRGITIELGADTSGVGKALEGVNRQLNSTKAQLKDVEKLLKLDPGNTELLTQKQKLLGDSIKGTEEKLKTLRTASEQAAAAMADGDETAKAQYDALQREIIETEQQMKSLKQQMKDFGSVATQQIAAAGAKVQELGEGISKAGATLSKTVTAGVAAAATASVAAFKEVDEGLDVIVTKTGATGEALADMQERAKNLATSIPTDFTTAGNAVAEVNTRFNLTGDALESLSGKFIKFASLNNTDVVSSIDGVQAAMAAMHVGADKAGDFLDILNRAGQDTGVSMDKLTGDLTANATSLQEMGFGISSATGFLANLNKNGLDTSTVLTGMKTALKTATKEGKTMGQAMGELMGRIQGAKSETEAMQLASGLFGTKAGPAMAKAIREGRLSFDEFSNAVQNARGSVENTFEATLDPIDEFKTSLNETKIVGAEVVNAAAPMIKELAESVKTTVQNLRAAWESLSPAAQQLVVKLALLAAAVGPLLIVGGKVVSGVGRLMTLAPKILSIGSGVLGILPSIGGALSSLWGVLAANPILLLIAAVAALIALFRTLWNNSKSFRDLCENLGVTLRNLATTVGTAIRNFFANAWTNITTMLRSAASGALNWGRDLVQNFINGIGQMWNNLRNTVSNVGSLIRSYLGFSEPEQGPLSNFHTYAPDMMRLFAQGIRDNANLVTGAVREAFDVQPEIAASAGGAGREVAVPRGGAGAGAGTQTVILQLDRMQLGRAVFQLNNEEMRRMGVQLTGGGA